MPRSGLMFARSRVLFAAMLTLACVVLFASSPAGQGQRGQGAPPPQPTPPATGRGQQANFDRALENQKQVDDTWRKASEGVMKMEKTTYKSRADGLEIPVFIFQPLQIRGPKGHPAIVWVHPDIRGHLYEYYIPYVREAVKKGYVVIAPEYRGSVGYGQEFYDAIDYGGLEVDDVLTAVDVLKTMPHVDPERIGIIGWSHGGMITLLSITREKEVHTFKAAVAMVPVTNLFQRLARKGVEQYHSSIDPANRIGGTPAQKPDEYRARSAIYQIDRLQIPLLVHVARNDTDVNIEEDMQLIDALRARKPDLQETKVYDAPKGGHLFDRQTIGGTTNDTHDLPKLEPENTREQRDSWERVWTFFDWNLDVYKGVPGK